MKKLLAICLFLMAGSAFADSTNQTRLRNVGLSTEQTRELDAIYHAGRSAGESVLSPVFVATPVAAVNQVQPGVNVVPPTATANTQAFLGAVVPVVGQVFDVYNSSASTVALKAQANMKINDLGATGEKLPVAAKCRANCITATGITYNAQLTPTPGSYACGAPVCPTPTP